MDNKQDDSNKWLILFVVILGIFMQTLDSSIVNLAISKMMHTFNSTLDQIQWVISVYALVVGIVTPASGYLGDRFGIKKVFISALVLFTFGSLLCGISWNAASIIAFRIIQGIGGAALMPIGMIILMNSFDKNERGMAIGLMGMSVMAAPALGPTLGGYIIDKLDWRLVFFINIPIGIITSIVGIMFLRETEHKSVKGFDFIGFLTAGIGLGCILYVLGKDNIDWGDIKYTILLIIGGYNLCMFIVNELMIAEPMLDLRLLKNYTFCMSTIIMNVTMLVLLGGIFIMPVFLQQLKGFTPLQTGMVLFPEAIAIAFSVVIAGKITDQCGIGMKRGMLIMALVFLTFNSYSMSKLTLNTSAISIMLLLMVRGLGIGFLMTPVQVMGLNAVPKEMNSNASALMNTLKQIGSAVGITLVTSIIQHRNSLNYASLSQQVNYFNPGSMKLFKMLEGLLIHSGMHQIEASSGALGGIYALVAKQTQVQSLNDTMLIISGITILIILPSLLLRENKHSENKAGT
jgi:drug resistance transporter, EmrB/QacA subfamily